MLASNIILVVLRKNLKEVPRLSFAGAIVLCALAFAAASLPPFATTAFAACFFPAADLRRGLLSF
jgi:hypothetical protein